MPPSSLTQGTRIDGEKNFYTNRNKLIDYKTYMEDTFEKCNDKWDQDVKLRLVEIPNHIVSSDGRYHKD